MYGKVFKYQEESSPSLKVYQKKKERGEERGRRGREGGEEERGGAQREERGGAQREERGRIEEGEGDSSGTCIDGH